MNNKLPWEAYFYGTIDKRTIRDAERHTVNVYDAACAEFIVTACNAYEANQAEITQLKAKLELCREGLQHTLKRCKMIEWSQNYELFHGKSIEALETIEGRGGNVR
jgi:hypothetical protein